MPKTTGTSITASDHGGGDMYDKNKAAFFLLDEDENEDIPELQYSEVLTFLIKAAGIVLMIAAAGMIFG